MSIDSPREQLAQEIETGGRSVLIQYDSMSNTRFLEPLEVQIVLDALRSEIGAQSNAAAQPRKGAYDTAANPDREQENALPASAAPSGDKSDGFAVLLDDKSAPAGYWFVGCYVEKKMAEQVARKSAAGARVVPIWFARSATGPRDIEARRWRFLEHGCRWVSWIAIDGSQVKFEPRELLGSCGLQAMRAAADEGTQHHLRTLREGIKAMAATSTRSDE